MSQLSCLGLSEIFDNIHQNSIVHSKLQETCVNWTSEEAIWVCILLFIETLDWLCLFGLILSAQSLQLVWSENDDLPVSASLTCLRIIWAITFRVISSLFKKQKPRSRWYLDHYSHRVPTATSHDKCRQELIGELTSGEKGAVHLPYPVRSAALQTELI